MINLEKLREKKSLKELLEFGIINLDKPINYTSFQTGEIVGKMLGLRKFSHAGTLDPGVSGVLPILLNRACKLLGWFMKKNKTYIGIMKIHKEIDEAKLKDEMQKFVGKIKQLPPVKSRVKRQIREREVYSWKILEIDKEKKEVLFEAEVEAGTYIRKLISDLGEKIKGAHMIELRRTKAGIFDEKNSINLYELEKIKDDEEKLKEIIIPGEIIGEILNKIEVKEEAVKNLLTGKPLFKEDIQHGELKEGSNAVFSDNKFIGIYKKAEEKNIIARAEFVFN
jgi:H/ACA ribonucleoprotein complex subunit 4